MAKSTNTKTTPRRAGVPGRRPTRIPTAAAARVALWQAIDRACRARGEAQWLMGYRTGRLKYTGDDAEDTRMYQKAMAQFEACVEAEARVTRALAAYVRAIRTEK